MEDVLKYQRLQGAVDSIIAKDRISASALEGNFLVVGTERGIVHILALTGVHIQRYTPHPGRPVRGLSLCYDGVLSIFSCAEDDDTVVYCVANSEDLRTTTYQFSETVTAIAVDYTSAAYKNDGMILVGTQSGRLIKYRPSVLFGKREKRVEDGKNSPVKAIAWNDNLVAWADDEGLYLFDIATKSAIGRVPTPCGPGDRDLYPVSIRWTDTDQLLLGWAYTVTVLKVKTSVEEGLLTEAGNLVLKVVHSWETDCVVAGIHAFDRDHILYLGYSTISADEMGYAEDAENGAIEEGDENEDVDADHVGTAVATTDTAAAAAGVMRSPGATADLEVIVAKIGDGDIVSADVLPLRGNLYLSQGPFQFQLLSSYDTRTLLRDPPHRQWQLHHYNEVRGGDQGKAPLLFISSPEDIVVGRVRDVNDRVRAALGHGDLKLAVEVAQYDRASLRVYGYAELLEGYITQLLHSNEPAMAAKEIARLAGMDAILWETWVYRFVKMGLLDYLCLEIPTQKPRLERHLYEEVLDQLLTKHPEKLVPTLQTWSSRGPTTTGAAAAADGRAGLYDREALVQRLEKQLRLARRIAMAPVDVPLDAADELAASYEEPSLLSSSAAAPTSREDGILSRYQHTQEAKWRRQRRRETRHAARHYFAALAHLHLLNKNYEKALNCYLHRLPRSTAAAAGATSVAVPTVGGNAGKTAASSVSSSSGKSGSLLGNSNVASSSTGSGRTTSQARRETSVSTLQASEAARQVQQDVGLAGAAGDADDVDFDLESDDDDVDEGLVEGGEAHVGGASPVRERRKALDETLQSNAAGGGQSSNGSGGNGGNGNGNSISEHRHVFELIEKENLFHSIAGKIRYLVRLSRPLCQRLLLSHLDKLPIGSVAAQLQSDRDLLRWYLTALFADVSARETYRAKEFSNLHLKQLQLSIEHRARTVLQQYQWQAQQGLTASSPWSAVYAAATATNTATTAAGTAAVSSPPGGHQTTLADASDLLTFLKAGWVPASVALQEIDQFTASPAMMDLLATYNPNNNNQQQHLHASFSLPPVEPLAPHQLLCEERVYLLAMQGEKLAALRLLLETDDVDRVLSFLTVHGHGHAARYFQPSAAMASPMSAAGYHHHHYDDDARAARDPNSYELQREGQQLWEEVVRRGLESPSFLQVLVTRLGDAGMDGTLLLRRLSEHVEHIPQFRQKMTGVVLDLHTMETLNRTCRALQQDEALALLGQKNRRQRRAIKIEARSSTMQRCTICLRPLGTEASPPTLDQAMLLLSKGGAMELQLPCAPSEISICGTHASATAMAASSSSSSSSSSSAAGGGHHHHHHPHAVHPLLFFNAKNAVHHSCFSAIVRAEGESRRVAEESKELIGGVASSVMEKRGMVARAHHTQVHR